MELKFDDCMRLVRDSGLLRHSQIFKIRGFKFMKKEENLNFIYDSLSKTIIFSYFVFLVLLIVLISLDYISLAVPNEKNLLEYTGLSGNFFLIGVTAKYAYDNHKMLKQNNVTQKMNLIKERLEKLYLPLKFNLNSYSKVGHILDKEYYEYNKDPSNEKYLLEFKKSVLDLSPYIYLASDNLKPLLIQLFSYFNKNYYIQKKERDQRFGDHSVPEKLNSIMAEIDEKNNLQGNIYYILKKDKENFNNIYEQMINIIDSDIDKYENYLFNIQ